MHKHSFAFRDKPYFLIACDRAYSTPMNAIIKENIKGFLYHLHTINLLVKGELCYMRYFPLVIA